ncbi:MAG: citrate synthase [Bacteroidetes bacterium]|nr:citrate synthase [Bacteroidota bacterium]MCH8523047.1 citrate synthase [Balneolales bacterium]
MNNQTTGQDVNEYPYLDKGLEGIVAFSSKKSFIDGAKGELIYAGYNIELLAEKATFEEVCFLLWNERLPNKDELTELHEKLVAERDLPETVYNYISSTDKKSEPMAVLRTATSMLADSDPDAEVNTPEANLRKAIRLTAKMPTIIAAYDRSRKGLEIVKPASKGSTAFNFLYMINNEEPGPKAERVMDLLLVTHAEHGMNASTFSARAIGSTLSDMHSSITGAIGSLKGPLHGGANTAVMNMLKGLDKDTDIRAFIKGKLERKEKVMGFGHRVYKTFDPRAKLIRVMAKDLAKEVEMEYLYEWSETILTVMKEEKNIDPNVDFFSATVYYSMGIMPDMYTCIFAMARISGWTAHYIEQMENNRLVRPRQLYLGEKNLPWVKVEDR